MTSRQTLNIPLVGYLGAFHKSIGIWTLVALLFQASCYVELVARLLWDLFGVKSLSPLRPGLFVRHGPPFGCTRTVLALYERFVITSYILRHIYYVISSNHFLIPLESNFLIESKTTDLAGILTPMANVSVANNILTSPRANKSSIVSFKIGKIPE